MFTSIRSRLFVGLGMAWVLALAIALAGVSAVGSIHARDAETIRRITRHMGAVEELQSAITGYETEIVEMIYATTRDGIDDESIDESVEFSRRADAARLALQRLDFVHADAEFVVAEANVFGRWDRLRQDSLGALAVVDPAVASELAVALGLGVTKPSTEDVRRLMDEDREDLDSALRGLRNMHVVEAERSIAAADATAERAQVNFVVVASLALVILSLGGYWLYSSIQRPLESARAHAIRIGEGELSTHFDGNGPLEIAALTDALDLMRESLLLRIEHLGTMAEKLIVAARNGTEAAASLVDAAARMSSADVTRSQANDIVRESAARVANDAGELRRLVREAEDVIRSETGRHL